MHEPEIGIVETVEIIDFMCHGHAKVTLCPKVNFITGQNGSGKSAILTALVVALGGKANTTNRASNLRGLIREGRPKATVRVHLRNRGTDAYRPEEFSNSIIIERQLSTGNVVSQFKIKNGKTGEIVSRKKEDVVAITDHMAIQVDNPINILSQDAAREFLASTSPDKMYHFFLKGTQLYQLREDLDIVCQAISRAESSIERKKEVLPEMKAEKKRWERHYEDMRQARDLSTKMNALSNQMAWAIVEEAEEGVKDLDEELEVQTTKIEKIDSKIDTEQAAIAEIEKQTGEFTEQAQRKTEQLQPLQLEKAVPQEQQTALKATLRSLKQSESEMNTAARDARMRIESLKKDIAAERARCEDDNRTEKERIREKIAELEQSKTNEENAIAEEEENKTEYERQSESLQEQKAGCQSEIDKNYRLVDRAKTNLDALVKQTSNRLAAFGQGVSEALKMIERAQWRDMKPIGPIGSFLKLHDSKWNRIVETALDKQLNSFLVGSHADQVTLDGIFRRCRCQSRIVICKNELFDYSSGEPSSKYLTILRAMDVQNELVKRQFINLNRIEQIVLVEQRSMGDTIMSSNRGGAPGNVTVCLSQDGYNVAAKMGGLSTQAINLVRPTNRLGGDISDAIAHEKEVLAEHQRALQHAQRSLEDFNKRMKEFQRMHQKSVDNIRVSNNKINQARMEMQQLREKLQGNEPSRLVAMETELETVENQLELIQTQFRDHYEQKRNKEEELEAVETGISIVDNKINAIREDIDELRGRAEQHSSGRQKHVNNIEYWNAKKESLDEKRNSLRQKLQEAERKVAEVEADARKICPGRVDVEHPPARLDRMISDCRARLEEIERSSNMTLAEVAEKAQLHIDNYKKASEELRSIAQLIKTLKTAHHKRMQKWTQFRDSMAMRTKMHFITHLAQRGFTGKLEFDHSQRTLTPKTQTDQDMVSEAMARANGRPSASANGGGERFLRKDTKSLSGGEKSFTTICLLLSLWETMNCPVRALDEFDVFMDAANRTITMSMMIDSARATDVTQFILITPLDMPVKPDADISILRLEPPRQNRQ